MNIKRVLPAGQRPFLYIQVNCSTWNNRVMNKKLKSVKIENVPRGTLALLY